MLHAKTAASTCWPSVFLGIYVNTSPCGVAAPYGGWHVVWVVAELTGSCCVQGTHWHPAQRAGGGEPPACRLRGHICALPAMLCREKTAVELAAAHGRIGATCLFCHSSSVSTCGL